MSFSNPANPANPDLLSTFMSPDEVSAHFDRSILGIPAEEDEYSRNLFFSSSPSTGQPSVTSTSQGFEGLGETPSYGASRSSHNTSSPKIFTPQSVSDASGWLHPQIASSSSIESSDRGPFDRGADFPHSPSTSTRASAGTSEATPLPSPTSTQTPTHLPTAESYTATTMSLAVGGPVSEPFGSVIHIDEVDIKVLGDILRLEYQSRQLGTPLRAREKSSHRPTARLTSTMDAIEKAKSTEKSKLMRQLGVCLPCLVNHEECDRGEPCPRCFKSAISSKIPKTPCVRPHLSQAVLFRTGALSFPMGPPKMKDWGSGRQVRNVPLLLYNIGHTSTSESPVSRPNLAVICREFPDTQGIRSVKSWTKGAYRIDIRLPNFAMTMHQCSETSKKLDVLVDDQYNKLAAELAIGQDDIISRTLTEAVRQAEKCRPIKDALKLVILSRLASKSFNIYGQETLGIQQEQDPECPYYNRIPIPPLLDAQMDCLLMEKMKTLRRTVLSWLRRKIAGQGRKHWFKIYLTISVLLFNLEFVYRHQRRQIKRYEEPTPQQERMLDSWDHAARNLTQHFRAVCRGNIPFNMVWSREDQEAAEVDDRSLEFIAQLKELVQSRGEDLPRPWSASPEDTPLVWISALFEP